MQFLTANLILFKYVDQNFNICDETLTQTEKNHFEMQKTKFKAIIQDKGRLKLLMKSVLFGTLFLKDFC